MGEPIKGLSGLDRRASNPKPNLGIPDRDCRIIGTLLDGVHPKAGGRRVLEGLSAMSRQPVHDGPVLMGRVVV